MEDLSVNSLGGVCRNTRVLTVKLLRYNIRLCYVSNINIVLQSFHWPNFDTFFKRTSYLQQVLTRGSERVKHVYPENSYQIQETLLDKLNSFGIEHTNEQALCKNLAVFDFLNQFVCKKRASKTLRQQTGLDNIFQSQSPYHRNLSSN